jgi:hypothetical protein
MINWPLASVFDPVKTHINGFGATLFDLVVGYSGSDGVVGLDRSCWLRVSHFVCSSAEHACVFGVVEKGA